MTDSPHKQLNQLIEDAKNGSERAFEEVYAIFFGRVYRYVAWRVADQHITEDLVQQVFMQMTKGLSTYTVSDKPFIAWLFTIARNTIASYYRKAGATRETPTDTLELSEIHPQQSSISAAPQAPDLSALDPEIYSALQALTEDQRTVIFLRFFGGLSIDEVSAATRKAVTAVKALQHRGMLQLGKTLGSLRESSDVK